MKGSLDKLRSPNQEQRHAREFSYHANFSLDGSIFDSCYCLRRRARITNSAPETRTNALTPVAGSNSGVLEGEVPALANWEIQTRSNAIPKSFLTMPTSS